MEKHKGETIESIQTSFMALYEKQKFEKITVKELCANTPVARTTFYAYYNNTDDVKNEIEDRIIDGLRQVTDTISQGNIPEMDFIKFLDATQAYIEANWTWIYAFMVTQVNQRFIDKWKAAICDNFKKRYPQKQSIRNYDLISEVVASATMGAYIYWMKFPDKVKKEDMKEVIKNALDSLIQVL